MSTQTESVLDTAAPIDSPEANNDIPTQTEVSFKKIIPKGKKNIKKRIASDPDPGATLASETDTPTSSSSKNTDSSSVYVPPKTKKSFGIQDDIAASESVAEKEGDSSHRSAVSSTGATIRSQDQYSTLTANFDDEEEIEKKRYGGGQESSERVVAPEGTYKGLSAYQHAKSSGSAGRLGGTLKALKHIRVDVRMDYAPDVCKDFKETGYCGYGDNCKFLHDRSDYKSGWKIDKEIEDAEKQKKQSALERFLNRGKSNDNQGLTTSGDSSTDLPFACFICRKPFESPVVTRCEHYFCQKCALQRYSTTPKCAVCGEHTQGSFNTAHKILKRRDDLKKLAELN